MSDQHQGAKILRQDDYALSIKQAAERACVSPRTMWRLVSSGVVRSVKASARRRIIMASELARHLTEGLPE